MNDKEKINPEIRRGIFNVLESLVYSSRILLIPFLACLVAALISYSWVIIVETKAMLIESFTTSISSENLLFKVLSIVDIVMISNLIVMILIGSYSIFVRKIDVKDHKKRPQWLDHISSGSLKVKISMSIVGVSSIHLLKIFVEPVGISTKDFIIKIIIHLFFIVAAYFMAKTNAIVEGTNVPGHSHNENDKNEDNVKDGENFEAVR